MVMVWLKGDTLSGSLWRTADSYGLYHETKPLSITIIPSVSWHSLGSSVPLQITSMRFIHPLKKIIDGSCGGHLCGVGGWS